MYAKFSKFDFYQDKIKYLGHIISAEGILIDAKKTTVIMEWPTPRNVTEARSFMGLDGYYRRFIQGFSRIAHLITSLQRKGIKFVWTDKCEESFRKLNYLITTISRLNYRSFQGFYCVHRCM